MLESELHDLSDDADYAASQQQFASERITGRLKLIKQSSSLFMTWIPHKAHSSDARLSDKDRNLYTIRAVPFTDISIMNLCS